MSRRQQGTFRALLALVALPLAALAFMGPCGVRTPGQLARVTGSGRIDGLQTFARSQRVRSIVFSTEEEEPMIGPMMPGSAPPKPVEVAEEDLTPEEKARKEKLAKIEALKAKEVFQTKETGDYECKQCGWQYKEEDGFGPYKPGTPFAALPATFKCPKCKADKSAFGPLTLTIAGFVDNSKYGFGGNSLTSEQKSGLIFGGLFFFFALFISGYLLE